MLRSIDRPRGALTLAIRPRKGRFGTRSVRSSQVQRLAAEQGLSREQAALQPNLGADQIMKRIADTREIGYAALFLASDEASFMTGAT